MSEDDMLFLYRYCISLRVLLLEKGIITNEEFNKALEESKEYIKTLE